MSDDDDVVGALRHRLVEAYMRDDTAAYLAAFKQLQAIVDQHHIDCGHTPMANGWRHAPVSEAAKERRRLASRKAMAVRMANKAAREREATSDGC